MSTSAEKTVEPDEMALDVGTLRVLAVDDEPDILEIVSRALAMHGHEITTAGSGEEALRLCDETDFALVITDLNMPGMHGIELIAQLASRHPDTAVAIATGHGELETSRMAIELGVKAYVLKPVSPAELIVTVERVLEDIRIKRERDILHRELKARCLALQRSEATREALVSIVTDELRGPLGLIRTNLELLSGKLSDALTEDEADLFTDAYDAVGSAFQLADELLAGRLLESGGLHVEIEAVSLAEAVEQAKLELLRASEEEEGVAIRGGVPQDAIPVMADRKLLRWVLKRLLRWAVSKASAQVLIRGIEDDVSPRVELIVESDGVGERAQDEPGKVVEGALDRSFCRLAVEALGGELRGFNGGNICRLVLPAACAHALQPGGAL